uniref:DAGKc domain-containing protein n=1 Tax=Rhabditophanes sp. KR3021 TaxID=114890 RepID=A0AC35TFM4_9BILA
MFVVNKITKVGTTLVNHKKKAIAGAIAVYFGVEYAKGNIRDSKIRNYYSQIAVKYGQETVKISGSPRRLTILVNKSANERKVFDKFKDNALPLFHLAGIEVTVLICKDAEELEAIGATINEDEADCLYVVGGDGTMSRLLTGIFKHKEEAELPIGMFPGGNANRGLLDNRFDVFAVRDDVAAFCESAMAVIENTKQSVYPVKWEISKKAEEPGSEADLFELQTMYSLNGLRSGWFAMVEEHKHKLWYWGGLDRYFTYLWDGIKRFPGEYEVCVNYTKFCPGCDRCLSSVKKSVKKIVEKESGRSSWWSMLIGSGIKIGSHKKIEAEEVLPVNEECGKAADESIVSRGIDIIVDNETFKRGNGLKFVSGGENFNRIEAVKDGWKRTAAGGSVFVSPSNEFYKKATAISGNSMELLFKEMPKDWTYVWIAGEKIDLGEAYNTSSIKAVATKKKIEMYLPDGIRYVL